jgi:hypothetical protein
MKRMLFVTEIAHLATEIEENYSLGADRGGPSVTQNKAFALKNKSFDLKKLRNAKRTANDSDSSDDEDDAAASEQSSPPASPTSKSNSVNSTSRNSPGRPAPAPAAAPSNLRESMLRYRANTEDLQSNSNQTFATMANKTSNMDDMSAEATVEVPMLGNKRVHTALGDSEKLKLIELIGEWEEPTITIGKSAKTTSLQDILQFRQAVLCLDSKHPFSYAFGPANTREKCIESAQDVYNRLMLHTPDLAVLQFDTLALIALDKNGEIDEKKARRLIRLFRPARDGSLTALDFVKSCDKIYKDLRTLRAAIANSSQVDLAFERLVNVAFYFILAIVVLTILQLDPWTLFLSLSGVSTFEFQPPPLSL